MDLRSSVPVRTAFISDIHGNVFALRAVLEEIASNEVQRIVCLSLIHISEPTRPY